MFSSDQKVCETWARVDSSLAFVILFVNGDVTNRVLGMKIRPLDELGQD